MTKFDKEHNNQLAKCDRGDDVNILIRLLEYKGSPYIDARFFDKDGKPTIKGVTIRTHEIDIWIKALMLARKIIANELKPGEIPDIQNRITKCPMCGFEIEIRDKLFRDNTLHKGIYCTNPKCEKDWLAWIRQ